MQRAAPLPAAEPDAQLRGALRALRSLRDKSLLVALGEAVAGGPARARAVAEQVALLRASGVRPVLVCEAAGDAAPAFPLHCARAVVAALEAEGERGLVLPALNVLNVHALPSGVAAAGLPAPGVVLPDGRFALPAVNPVALVHLQALGYVPVLVPPVMDQDGGEVELGAAALSAALAHALEAPALVTLCEETPPGAAAALAPRTARIDLSPDAAGDLLARLLRSLPSP